MSTTLTLVQRGTPSGDADDRILFLGFLIGRDAHPSLRVALGPHACILATEDAKPPSSLQAFVDFAVAAADVPPEVQVVLFGFSMGCSTVRRLVAESYDRIAGVITADGTHASMPPAASQLDPWRRLAADARAGTKFWEATCTSNSYVEGLHPPDGPYLSTLSVLRLVTGAALLATGTVDDIDGGLEEEGSLAVYHFASGACDARAHALQLREVLPHLLAEKVRPRFPQLGEAIGAPVVPEVEPRPTLAQGSRGPAVVAWQRFLERAKFSPGRPDGIFGPLTAKATTNFQLAAELHATGAADDETLRAADDWTEIPPRQPGPNAFVEALLAQARADIGERETLGPNCGAAMKRYQDHVHVPEGSEYCAAAVTTWTDAAAMEAHVQAVKGSAAAKGLMGHMMDSGRWTNRRDLVLADIKPGMVMVRDRGGWKGHVGVVEWVDQEGIHLIEANAGPKSDGVFRVTRQLSDPQILGFGWTFVPSR